jgi:hypothetical protein
MDKVFPLRQAAVSGNRAPMARDDVVQVSSLESIEGGLPQATVPVLTNDSDADEDSLTIIAVSNPEHGTAAFDFVAQTITYTASSAEVENDSFTYTIVDGSGGSSIGHVLIRADAAGTYTGEVSSPKNPGTGVVVDANRKGVARLELLGRTYRFTGRFNDVNQFGTVLASNSYNRKTLGIQLWLKPNGTGWTVEATIRNNWLPYSATCTVKSE